MSEELLPCPFCWSTDIILTDKDGFIFAECECGARGEFFLSGKQGAAITAWNTRPDSKPHKWKKYDDALKDDMFIGCFHGLFEAGFNAARERKE